MHVVTKVFIVLVALLAVLLVPLVVVYAHNEDSYKAKYEAERTNAASAGQALQAAEARIGAQDASNAAVRADLSNSVTNLRAQLEREQNDRRKLESDLAAASAYRDEINSKLAALASVSQAAQALNESLIIEGRGLRGELITLQRQAVELDESLREVVGQLEIAEAARRSLQEEMQRLTEENAKLMTKLGRVIEQTGWNSEIATTGLAGIVPDRTLTASVIGVQRSSDQVFVEIAAGSQDGVKKDWEMTIGNGGEYIGTIRIIEVDLKTAIGVMREESKNRGRVAIGHKAFTFAGQR